MRVSETGVRVSGVPVSPDSLLSPLGAAGKANTPLLFSIGFCSHLGWEAVTAQCHFPNGIRYPVCAASGGLIKMQIIWLCRTSVESEPLRDQLCCFEHNFRVSVISMKFQAATCHGCGRQWPFLLQMFLLGQPPMLGSLHTSATLALVPSQPHPLLPFCPLQTPVGHPVDLCPLPSSAGSGSASACCVPVGPCTIWAWISPALPLHSGQTGFLASLQSTHLPRCAL